MKTIALLTLLGLSGSAEARIGETLDQLKARYGEGKPSTKIRVPGTERYDFKKDGFTIDVSFRDGKSVAEYFHRDAGKISDDEIVQRLVFALVNEGARIVEEGIAARASDIDMVYITGYGFPIHRGGPMLYADQVGLFNVVQAMKRFQQNPRDDAQFWEPAPLLAKLAAEGKTFS